MEKTKIKGVVRGQAFPVYMRGAEVTLCRLGRDRNSYTHKITDCTEYRGLRGCIVTVGDPSKGWYVEVIEEVEESWD